MRTNDDTIFQMVKNARDREQQKNKSKEREREN